jgi:alkylhydroperoxidase family enzyme
MAFIDLDRSTDQPNHGRAFALRPAVYEAWQQLNAAIKAESDLRRYELATLAAARRLRSSYCCLAHGKVLAEQFYSADEVRALPDGLDETDRAIMELADKVVVDATSVTEADFDRLRALGLDDAEIMDVVLAAAARCFFSKTLDALGVQPDASYNELDPALRDALTVGRPIEPA